MKSYLVSDFKSDITMFRKTLMNVKTAMFNNKVGINSLDYNTASKNLRNTLNDLLRDWEKSGTDNLRIFSRYNIKDAPVTMPYDFFKDMAYADFDYLSITGFIAGIQQGITDEVITTPDGVSDFKSATIQQAFKGLWPDISETLREFTERTFSKAPLTELEVQMLKTIQGRAMTILDLSDRHKLHNSVMSGIAITGSLIDSATNTNLGISIITNAFEYMFFAVAAYMGRIMVINTMVADLLGYASTIPEETEDVEEVITESVLNWLDVPNFVKGCPVEALREMDISLFRDPNSFQPFFDAILELHDKYSKTKFMKMKHNDYKQLAQDEDAENIRERRIESLIGKDYKKNLFIAIICDYHVDMHSSSDYTHDAFNIKECHDMLEQAILAPLNGIPSEGSAFRHIVHKIAHANYGKDIRSLQSLLTDLCIFADYMCRKIVERIRYVNMSYKHDDDGFPKSTLSDQKAKSETLLLLTKAYQELTYAVYLRLMYLCQEMDAASCRNNKDFDQFTSLNSPMLLGSIGPENNMGDVMQAAMPDGLRMLNWNESFDALPEYEALTLYDEYVQTLPGFDGDIYYTEAVNDIINTMLSMIVGWFNSASAFFGKFGPAAKWVTNNESKLKALEFEKDAKIENVLPYNITNPDKYISGLAKLSSVNVKEAVKDLDKFTAGLYGNDKVYEWFKTDAATASKKFMNMVLFNDQSGSGNDISAITISGEEIKKRIAEWVDDVKISDDIVRKLKGYTDDFKSAINKLKSAGVQYMKESVYFSEADQNQAEEAAPPDNIPEPNISEDNKTGVVDDKKIKPNQQSKVNKPDVTSEQFNDLLTRANKAMTNICKPLYSGVAKAIRDEYSYIKIAYSISKKSTSGSNENPKDGTV